MDTLFHDIETNIEHPSIEGLLLVGYAVNDGPVKLLTYRDFQPDEANMFSFDAYQYLDLLQDASVVKVEHTKYDVRFEMLAGLGVQGPVHDTSVMAWTLNENSPLDLDWLAWRYAGIDMDKRLRRVSGRVVFTADDGTQHDLADHLLWSAEVWAQFEAYCRRDVDSLRKLYRKLKVRVVESEWWPHFTEELVPYTGTLARMETRGLPIDIPAVEALAAELEPERTRLAAELRAEAGLPDAFNINSGDQLAAYLFGRMVTVTESLGWGKDEVDCLKSCLAGECEDCDIPEDVLEQQSFGYHVRDWLPEGFIIDNVGHSLVKGHYQVKGRNLKETPPPINKVTGEKGKRPSTSSPDLLYMHASDPWVRKLCLEYRKVDKLLTTYLTKWPVEAVDGRLYGRFNQTGTVTGRLSSAGPNLQNVPARGERGKQVRGLFRAPEGKVLVVGDYDQLEMRLMAHFSEDPVLMGVFRRGEDPHVLLAEAIFGDVDATAIPSGAAASYRDAAKTLNYAMGYGAGPKKVAQTLSLMGWPTTVDTAKGYLAEMARLYRGLFRWKQHTIERAKRKGSVATIGGTRRRLRATFKDTANWKLVGYGERQAVNAIVQGSAADIIRRAMVRIEDEMPELVMLAQVHDELVFEYEARDALEMLAFDDGRHSPHNRLQDIAEMGHGFDLRVPLVFEPHIGRTWADAKSGAGVDLVEVGDE